MLVFVLSGSLTELYTKVGELEVSSEGRLTRGCIGLCWGRGVLSLCCLTSPSPQAPVLLQAEGAVKALPREPRKKTFAITCDQIRSESPG